jgi:glycosyltransferase involved in cell wall biosynthesis
MIVILSTLNGEDRLREMLCALLRVRIPAGTRFHVVDNGSTDATRALLESYSGRLPLTLHNQRRRGKNHCLNLAINEAVSGCQPDELVVLTDDDILPCPEWLEELDASGRAHPECDVFSGRIMPHWPCSGADHLEPLRAHFGILFSLTSMKEGPCSPELAWGPNMAVRAHVFQAGIRFDPNFGPNGREGYPMGSETELMERLSAAGHRAWFVERACVRHMIRTAQLEPESIIQRAFRHGYGLGWRKQRNLGLRRLLAAHWIAARALVSARVRRVWASPSSQLLLDYNEAWARGLSSGSAFEYRRARNQAAFAQAFPERRQHPRP